MGEGSRSQPYGDSFTPGWPHERFPRSFQWSAHMGIYTVLNEGVQTLSVFKDWDTDVHFTPS